jgi:hypothetical protein
LPESAGAILHACAPAGIKPRLDVDPNKDHSPQQQQLL